MARHTQRNVAFIIFAIIIIGSMLFLAQQGVAGEIEVRLPPPAQLTDAGFIPISLPIGETVVEATGINCKVKQTTLVFGENNRQLLSLDSGGIQGSPFIRLAFLQGGTGQVEVVAYNANPKIFCSDANNLPIEVAIRDMQLTVRGDYTGLSNVLQTQGVVGSRLLSFGQGQGEQTLISFPVQVIQLENQLPNQDFALTLFFEITGKVNVYYRDFPSLVYSIPIFRDDLKITHTIDIRKAPTAPPPPLDSDGDGYPDSTDQCPTARETFNGFQDEDGCPDQVPTVITCSDGSVVSSTDQCPTPPPTCESQDDRDCSKALCEADGGVFIEERNILNQVTGSFCELDTTTMPICQQDEKLELQVGNIFICVPDPDLQDTDGDGILNGIDDCPNQFGVPEFNGCPEGVMPPPPPTGTLQEQILSGDILTVIEVVFDDGSSEVILGSLKQGTGTTATLTQTFGSIIPAQITGTIGAGQVKPISEINYIVFFQLSNTQEVSLLSSDLSHILTVIESSVSKASGNVVFLSGETLGASSIQGTGITSINGWILGESTVTALEILRLAEQVIPPEQSRDADITISYDGTFTFNKGIETETFVISNSEITFRDFQITREKVPVTPINCEKQGLLPVKNEFGEVIGCKAPDPTDVDIQNCTSSERSSFLCDSQYRADNCNNTTTCTEPDDDGDGIPNFRNGCINDPEDGIGIGTSATDGCPTGRGEDPTPPPCPIGQVCKPPIPPEPPVTPVCSEQNPESCIVPPEQFLTIVIIGAVVAIVIGVVVAVASRRRTVFGT